MDADNAKIKELEKKVKDLQSIEEKDPKKVSPEVLTDVISRYSKSVKGSMNKLKKRINTFEQSKTVPRPERKEATHAEEEDEDDDVDYEYQHAWILRIVCMFAIGASFMLLAEKLMVINKAHLSAR